MDTIDGEFECIAEVAPQQSEMAVSWSLFNRQPAQYIMPP